MVGFRPMPCGNTERDGAVFFAELASNRMSAGAAFESLASAGEASGHQWREVNLEVMAPVSGRMSRVMGGTCPSGWRGWDQSRQVSARYRLVHLLRVRVVSVIESVICPRSAPDPFPAEKLRVLHAALGDLMGTPEPRTASNGVTTRMRVVMLRNWTQMTSWLRRSLPPCLCHTPSLCGEDFRRSDVTTSPIRVNAALLCGALAPKNWKS